MPTPVSVTPSRAYSPGMSLHEVDRRGFVQMDAVDGDGDASAIRHGVPCVDDQVQHDLLDLRWIGAHFRGLRLEDHLDFDFRTDQPPQHRVHAADDVVERQELRSRRLSAAEGEQLAREARAALHRALDFVRFVVGEAARA